MEITDYAFVIIKRLSRWKTLFISLSRARLKPWFAEDMATIESGETCLNCCEMTCRNFVFYPAKLLCYSHESLCDSCGCRHVQSLFYWRFKSR